MPRWNTAAVLIAAFFALSALVKNPLRRNTKQELSPQRERLLLILVWALALFVRLWRFGAVPGGVNQDGAMAAVDAKALADYGTDRFGMLRPVYFTAWGYGQMSVMMSYLMAPLIRLFGMNVYTLRLPCLLCSLGGLAAAFVLARRSWGRETALWVLFFAAIDPWHIMQSRWALDCNLYPHFLLFGMAALREGAEGKKGLLCLSMLLFGLSMYCYGIAAYTTPLFLLLACAALLARKKVTWKQVFLCAGVFLLTAWPFFAVLVINTFRLETLSTPFFTMPRFPYTVRSADILFFSDNIPAQLLENAKNAWRLLVRQGKDLAWNDLQGFGTVYLFSLPLTLLGAWELWKKRKETGSTLVLLLFVTGLVNILLVRGANVNRANAVFYATVIFTAAGLAACSRRVRCASLGLGCVYLVSFALFCGSYFGSWSGDIERHFLKDFGEAVTAMGETDAEVYCVTQDSQYSTASNVSEILTLYYLNVDSGYFRGETNDQPPYYARFRYGPSALWPLEGTDAAYVIRGEEGPRFERQGYAVTYYGRFAMAVAGD